jgi:hypothetical protein
MKIRILPLIGWPYLSVNQYVMRGISNLKTVTSEDNVLAIPDVNAIRKGTSDHAGIKLYRKFGLEIPTIWGMKY